MGASLERCGVLLGNRRPCRFNLGLDRIEVEARPPSASAGTREPSWPAWSTSQLHEDESPELVHEPVPCTWKTPTFVRFRPWHPEPSRTDLDEGSDDDRARPG